MTRSDEPHDPDGAPEPSDAKRLWRKLGEGVEPEVSAGEKERAEAGAPSGATNQLLGRLAEHGLKSSRYKLDGEVARGGMGAILRVWDEDLRRHLAMKVVLGRAEVPGTSGTPATEPRVLARFLEEAQVTGQLDHPGIVPVHELGLDADGRVYFTMKLVKGRDLKTIFDLVFQQKEGWNETRALGVILKVCEAMAYAHAKGVVHRDLKPANVMVGGFGEVYVMDWGLARVLGRKDSHDIRLVPEVGTSLRSVRTERREEREVAPDSPLVTMDGDIMGTPSYMPPEQARGEVEKLGPRSDVYSVGAMLYHLLARQVPYVSPGAKLGNYMVLRWVLEGPPKRLHELRSDVPAELAAICDKAMDREAERRYPDTLALAEDLRAYLEHRVVSAYETGAIAELKKWVARNRGLAASITAAVLILIAGLVTSSSLYVKAEDKATEADRERKTAQQRADDVLSLSAIQNLQEIVLRADELWPADPGNVAGFEGWMRDAHALLEGQPADAALGAKARPSLSDHRRKLAELEARPRPQSDEERWWQAQLSKLVADLEDFSNPATGLCSKGIAPEHGWGVEKRLDFARSIEERSVSAPEPRRLWDEAIASIQDRARSPKYDGLALAPQAGLLPIGRDAVSGLWEFADLATGDAAQRDAQGRLALTEATGLIFVLIPGGTYAMGTQSTDPTDENYDREAAADESPVQEVTLSPFFLSKYEMTQAQWRHLTGANPSLYGPHNYVDSERMNASGRPADLLHPVEQVSWEDCMEALTRVNSTLPTEAQWEYACRAGTSTVYWSGDEIESLQGVANVSDAYGKTHGNEGWAAWEDALDDGQTVHAAVGTYRASPFGLYDVHGNVWEWCKDRYGDYTRPVQPGDGERQVVNSLTCVFRGGSFAGVAVYCRSGVRRFDAPGRRGSGIGVRPARSVTAR